MARAVTDDVEGTGDPVHAADPEESVTSATEADALEADTTGPDTTGPEPTGPDTTGPGSTDVAPGDANARRDLRRTRILLGVLVLGLVAVAVLVWRVRAADAVTDDRAQAQDAARVVAEQMVTLTAQNAQQHVDVMLGRATDPFRQQLTGLAAAFEEILRQGQVAADGKVDTTGVASIGNGEAKVLVTATTTVRNTQIPDGAPRDYRLVIGLREVDGQWLVSSVDVAR